MNRRTFLSVATVTGGAVIAGIVAIPAALTSLSPVFKRGTEPLWVPVGALDSFPVEGVEKVNVRLPRDDWARSPEERGVFVWRSSAEEVVVFSRRCTDLGCPVTWDPGSNWFYCPCHGGIFSQDGTNVAGPPPRPLDRYANRVRDGVLEIDLRSVPPMT
jgi:menaquinol-cytochrome c reductase iron-sulfur subunit